MPSRDTQLATQCWRKKMLLYQNVTHRQLPSQELAGKAFLRDFEAKHDIRATPPGHPHADSFLDPSSSESTNFKVYISCS